MEQKENPVLASVSADSEAASAASGEAVGAISSSTGRSSLQHCVEEDVSSTSAITTKDETDAKLSDDLSKTLTFDDASSTTECRFFESVPRSPLITGMASGFDSADSTNDADFLTTQEAVRCAIDLVEKGLMNDEGKNMIESSTGDKSETVTCMDISDKSENNSDIGENKNDKEDSVSSDKSETITFMPIDISAEAKNNPDIGGNNDVSSGPSENKSEKEDSLSNDKSETVTCIDTNVEPKSNPDIGEIDVAANRPENENEKEDSVSSDKSKTVTCLDVSGKSKGNPDIDETDVAAVMPSTNKVEPSCSSKIQSNLCTELEKGKDSSNVITGNAALLRSDADLGKGSKEAGTEDDEEILSVNGVEKENKNTPDEINVPNKAIKISDTKCEGSKINDEEMIDRIEKDGQVIQSMEESKSNPEEMSKKTIDSKVIIEEKKVTESKINVKDNDGQENVEPSLDCKTDSFEIIPKTDVIPKNSEDSELATSENTTKVQVSGNEDMEIEQCPSIPDENIEIKIKKSEVICDENVALKQCPSTSDTAVKKLTGSNDLRSTMPVNIEIADDEVSVFEFERGPFKNLDNLSDKAEEYLPSDKPKTKATEFKLDDMVMSSDEDSEDLEQKEDTSIPMSTTPDLSLNADTNEGKSYVSSEDPSEDTENPVTKNQEAELMDTEEISTTKGELGSSEQKEEAEMEVEENCESSETKREDPSELDSFKNLANNNIEKVPTDNEANRSISDCKIDEIKNDSETKTDDSESVDRENNKSEAANNFTNTELVEKDNGSSELISNESVCGNEENSDIENMVKSALAKNEQFRRNLSLDSDDSVTKSSLGNVVSKDPEVISLVDDDDDDEVNPKKKPAAAINCVNPNCMSGEDLDKPAMFVLSYFGLKRTKGQQVCAECFNTVLEHQETLSTLLQEGKPLLSADFPSHKDVILLDSDEESLSDNESNLSDDTMTVIRENLDDLISESLTKYDLDFQLRESCNILNSRLDKLEEEAREITKRYDDAQNTLDEFRKRIYEEFHQETKEKEEVHYMECEIPPMPIIKSKLQNQLYNKELLNRLRKAKQEREEDDLDGTPPTRTIATKRVTYISQPQLSGDNNVTQDMISFDSEWKCEPPPTLPPPGVLPRPKLRVGDLAYTMKVSYFSIWVHCRVIEVIPRNPTENDPSTETYRVRLENVKKNSVRTVTGKYLAYPTPARVQLKVGTRVISIFKEEDEAAATKDNYYVGVVAEPPKSTNKYRYLVFFDDGYTQYCPHDNILVVCSTSKNVWEDIHPEPRDFIRNYLQQYPERPMVKLSRGQIVKVEWNGRWWIVRVLEVDGSLVKVHFDADKRTEWIYRGSTRLGPMYQELAAAKERQHGSLLRSRGFGGAVVHKSDMPYVEYTRGDGDENKTEEKEKSDEPVEETPPAPRSVARKSTAKKTPETVISNAPYTKPLINHVPEGKLRQRKLKPKCRPIQFRPHQCSEACIAWTSYKPAVGNKYDPLIRPLMFGFERLIGSFRGKTVVMYRAPCGRMIRTTQEMLCYLRGTKSQLTIDLFDFDFWVNPLNDFEEGNTFCRIEDLSYGKENVRISCVNELDHSMPHYVQYMTAREPAKDVNLNLDPEFLVGCDCTDDCEDRSKCSCWQLTMQGKAYVPDGDLDPLFGYQYRRLPERIATGIYECNSRCKCSATCQNRVAQQPLSCRLQLFKTLKKGWGIRCLHDIPRGAFICIYAGFLLTEQEANEGGKTYGDEYLAELDYIESVENLKEGYESEAKDPSDLEEDDNSQKDTMDIEYEHSGDSEGDTDFVRQRPDEIRCPPPPPTQNPWSLRLRRRTADESEKESRKSKTDDDAISISDDEMDNGNCGGCRHSLDNVKDTLRCQGCMKSYHFKCTPLKTGENAQKLGPKRSSWICPKCEALVRKPKTFNAHITVTENDESEIKYPSVRELYGPEENVYIMDAKTHGNIGRYLNHSCSPNVFVQNVFVDTHDLRFPWVSFFANQYIPAGTELTWDYNYDVGSVPGKVMLCYCGSSHCRGRLL